MFYTLHACLNGPLWRRSARISGAALVFWLCVCALTLRPGVMAAQRTVVFQSGDQTWRAEFFWAIKHAGNEYKSRSAHTIDRSKDASFDLEATFRFRNDSLPADNDVVWGFQFRQNGSVISPASNEKYTRSLRLFQRFQASGTGNASLTIIPKAWKRNAAGQYEAIGQAAPVTLGFSVTDGSSVVAPPAPTPAPAEPVVTTPPENRPVQPTTTPAANTAAQQAEAQAYAQAQGQTDSILRAKALLNFIDVHEGKTGVNSALVNKALKDVPMGISLPVRRDGGSFLYVLDNALNPVVDTGSLRGWEAQLTAIAPGRYELAIRYLSDSLHLIRIADIGKNAPYNKPTELRPFEKIQVELAGETPDSFRIRVTGGVPPFIVYLSQDNIPKIRYLLTRTDTTWTLGKSDCEVCDNGAHTLEVYNRDFSTLLLRAEKSIKISKTNYFYLALYGMTALMLLFFLYKPILRGWRHFQYTRTLRDIEVWERKVEEEERQRRTHK